MMYYRRSELKDGVKFGLVLVQDGEGCDYTIGCGIRVKALKATTLEEARLEAKDYLFGTEEESTSYLEDGGEDALEAAFLITSFEEIPLDTLKEEYLDACTKRVNEKIEAEERAELERLQRKYKR